MKTLYISVVLLIGVIFDIVTGNNQYKAIEDRMAQRTKDINGDFHNFTLYLKL